LARQAAALPLEELAAWDAAEARQEEARQEEASAAAVLRPGEASAQGAAALQRAAEPWVAAEGLQQAEEV
jgi:hypothetical protein